VVEVMGLREDFVKPEIVECSESGEMKKLSFDTVKSLWEG
jgi:hypothetical protein